MMRASRYARMALVLFGCVLLASGCGATRRGKTGAGLGGDAITPIGVDQLDGDYALAGRFEEANSITDVEFENVLFAFDSFQVDQTEVAKIQAVAGYMNANAGVRLVVEGHCDERGSAEYNMALGEHRALAVRAYLISLGIDGTRIQTRSFGLEMPLDPGHSPEAWRVNRRGGFALYR